MTYAHITGTARTYPIGKILCIGRNYLDHIRELGNAVPEAPIIFMKPASSVIADGETIVIPSYSQDCHYEAELALLVGTRAKNIAQEEALTHLSGFAVAIDVTLRDVQADLKKKGLPWDIAKGFDTSCPLSDFVPAESVTDPHDLQIRLSVNGELRQNGSTAAMIHTIPALVSYLSGIFTLEPGDVILTGTPAGAGPIHPGDTVEAEIRGVGSLTVTVR